MDFQRITGSVDTASLQNMHATIVGGAFWLAEGLVRCGLGRLTTVDHDHFSLSNLARQDAFQRDIGQPKGVALARRLRQINPDVEVEVLSTDFCRFTHDEFDSHFSHTNLFVVATDTFLPHARANREAVRLGKPALWIGLYPRGRAGEIIYYVPGVTPACHRCVAVDRYGASGSRSATPSDGGTIFDLHLVDSIAGQVALGILTRGAPNRYGRLIDQLGDRNLLQVKIDPTYRLKEQDIFQKYLGAHPANFSFTTIALPMEPEADCPDCAYSRATIGD